MDIPDCARADAVGEIECLVNVLSEHGGTQAIDGLVGTLNHLFQALELDDLHDRPKDLKSKQ